LHDEALYRMEQRYLLKVPMSPSSHDFRLAFMPQLGENSARFRRVSGNFSLMKPFYQKIRSFVMICYAL
jgi:hypothetical protein